MLLCLFVHLVVVAVGISAENFGAIVFGTVLVVSVELNGQSGNAQENPEATPNVRIDLK